MVDCSYRYASIVSIGNNLCVRWDADKEPSWFVIVVDPTVNVHLVILVLTTIITPLIQSIWTVSQPRLQPHRRTQPSIQHANYQLHNNKKITLHVQCPLWWLQLNVCLHTIYSVAYYYGVLFVVCWMGS